ncbi:MAG: 4'-phosphopantetheinyl transferase family protein [Oscillospiraceae bacterium]
MNILVLKVDDLENFELYSKYLDLISNERRLKIDNLKFNSLKTISLLAEILIRYQVSQDLKISSNNISFSYNRYGKPYLKSYLDYDFSISHSYDHIAFVSNNLPIGIDIEKVKSANLKIAKRFFTSNEYEHILKSDNLDLEFFKTWTMKEAYIKMLGVGLSKSLSSFDVFNSNLGINFYNTQIDNFQLSVCNKNLDTISYLIKSINLNELLSYF